MKCLTIVCRALSGVLHKHVGLKRCSPGLQEVMSEASENGVVSKRIHVVTSVHEKEFPAEQKRILSFPHNLVLNCQRPHLFPKTEDRLEAIFMHDQVICG